MIRSYGLAYAEPAAAVQVKVHIDLESGDLRCPRCFGKDLVSSTSRGLRDFVMRRLGHIPRHCRFCGKRFYVPKEVIGAGKAAPKWQGRPIGRPPE